MRKGLLGITLAVLLVIPVAAAADEPRVRLTGQGTIGPISSSETIRFSFTAVGNETSAQGEIEIRTIDKGNNEEPWSIHGTVVCIQYLPDQLIDANGVTHDVWEIRYRMVRSDFPADETSVPGAHASFYIEDAPDGDWAGELTGTGDYMQPECGPRGNPPIFPLQTGDIRTTTSS